VKLDVALTPVRRFPGSVKSVEPLPLKANVTGSADAGDDADADNTAIQMAR